MPQRFPTRDGFEAVARAPSLWLAEMTWRWSFGISSCLLIFVSLLEFLRSLVVSRADLLFLRSKNPFLVSGALGNIFSGSGPRLLRAAAILLPALTILWVLAATLGRAATLKFLLPGSVVRYRSLAGLSLFRAAVTLAAIVGFFGAAVLAGHAGAGSSEEAANAANRLYYVAAVFLGLSFVVACAWSILNWMLALAAIFAVRERQDTLGATAEAVRSFRRHLGQFFATSTWFGLLHLVAMVGASYVATLAVPLAAISRWAAVLVLIVVAALYFAAVDFLYIARLAAYVVIAEPPAEEVPETIPEPVQPAPLQP
jgi:hypothetical protein